MEQPKYPPRFKPSLSTEELKSIQERNHGHADVIRLLWEIKRLRSVVFHADQLQRSVPDLGGSAGMILRDLRRHLAEEAVIQEWRALDAPKVQPGDDD